MLKEVISKLYIYEYDDLDFYLHKQVIFFYKNE